jgi:hypothetical protein
MSDTPSTYAFEVEEYISSQEEPFQEWLRDLRVILHEAQPDLSERIERGLPVFSYYGEDICYIACGSEQITVGFYKGDQLPDPFNTLQGSGEKLRFIHLTKATDIKEQRLTRWIQKLTDGDDA